MKYSSQLLSFRDLPRALMGLDSDYTRVKDRYGGGERKVLETQA